MSKFILEKEDAKCAPSKKYESNSCYSLESLLRMTVAYNVEASKINIPTIQIKEDKRYLVDKLTIGMQQFGCSDQLCWAEQKFIRALNDAEINKNTFRPKISQGKFIWLNTTNIEDIMYQYEHKYKDYMFLGCVPIDFQEIDAYKFKHLDISDLYRKNICRYGAVINLDESWQQGSHWVAFYADIDKKQVYFFDSFGKKPVKRIRDLMVKFINWICEHKLKLPLHFTDIFKSDFKPPDNFKEIKYNTIQHQRKNSECGVYSVNMILRLLKGETFDNICNNITTDEEINKCRPVYFRFK